MADGLCSFRITLLEFGHATPQSRRVELINREDAHATLRTAWTTRQPVATLARSVGERHIHDLNEFRVGWAFHKPQRTLSITKKAANTIFMRFSALWQLNL